MSKRLPFLSTCLPSCVATHADQCCNHERHRIDPGSRLCDPCDHVFPSSLGSLNCFTTRNTTINPETSKVTLANVCGGSNCCAWYEKRERLLGENRQSRNEKTRRGGLIADVKTRARRQWAIKNPPRRVVYFSSVTA